jgi:hypothetical protein
MIVFYQTQYCESLQACDMLTSNRAFDVCARHLKIYIIITCNDYHFENTHILLTFP